jgi:hypothetical protein
VLRARTVRSVDVTRLITVGGSQYGCWGGHVQDSQVRKSGKNVLNRTLVYEYLPFPQLSLSDSSCLPLFKLVAGRKPFVGKKIIDEGGICLASPLPPSYANVE